MTSIRHPAWLFAIQLGISTLSIALFRPTSWMRTAFLPVLAGIMTVIMLTANLSLRNIWAAYLGGTSIALLLHYFDISELKCYDAASNSFPTGGVEKTSDSALQVVIDTPVHATRSHNARSPTTSLPARLRNSLLLMLNFRRIGTTVQVKNVPPLSVSDPTYTPSRSVFLRHKLLVLLLSYLLLDALTQAPPPPPAEAMALFSASKVPFLSRVVLSDSQSMVSAIALPITSLPQLRDELSLRAAVALGFWLQLYLMLQLFGSLSSLLWVGALHSAPSANRPLFGSLSDAWSLRQFWGVFWHQGLRGYLTAPVKALTRCLGMKRGLLRRYTELVGVFLLSGILHEGAKMTIEGKVWERELGLSTTRFFMTQTFGIMIEDAVGAIWKRANGEKGTAGKGRPLWIRSVGYVWVCLFFVWSVPMWIYPSAARATPEDLPFLPFSVIKIARHAYGA